jgi:cell shape-determining protein MreC
MKRTSRNSWVTPRRALRGVAIIVLIAAVFIWRAPLRTAVWRIAGPIYGRSPLSALSAQFHSKAALENENNFLRAALASTTAALADRNILYSENLELKSRVGRDAGMHTILAAIIARPPATPYDTLQIDAGSAHGVAIGALVSAGGTTIIGRIDSVTQSSARVALFSSPGESYQALLMKQSGPMPIVVDGQGGETLQALVPADSGASVGDAVVFSGISGGYSSTVVAIEKKSGESFETLYLRLPVNPQELQFVEVLRP